MIQQKGLSAIVVIIGIVLLSLILVGLFISKNNLPSSTLTSPSPTYSPELTIIENKNISDWKEYRDDQFKFSIKYPGDYIFTGNPPHNYFDPKTQKETDIKIYVFTLSGPGEGLVSGGYTGDRVDLSIYPEGVEPYYQYSSEDPHEEILIDGQKILKRFGLAGSIVNVGPITHQGKTFVFQYDRPGQDADQTNFNKIMSTFKLLD